MIHPTAVIETEGYIGEGTAIGPFVVMERGSRMGKGCTVDAGVFIAADTIIGDNVRIFANAVIGRQPRNTGALSRQPKAVGRTVINNGCVIGANASLYRGVVLGRETLIGDGVMIRENTELGEQCVVGANSTINCNTKIGNRTKIMDLSHVTADAVIGDDVFWSVNVISANDNAMGRHGYTGEEMGPVVKDGARIGLGAAILPGKTIHSRAIVASGSVVTHDVEEGELVMGVPARPRPSTWEEEVVAYANRTDDS